MISRSCPSSANESDLIFATITFMVGITISKLSGLAGVFYLGHFLP